MKLTESEVARELKGYNYRFTLTLNEDSPWVESLMNELWAEISKITIVSDKELKNRLSTVAWTQTGCDDYQYTIEIEHNYPYKTYDVRWIYHPQDYSYYVQNRQ